MTTNRGEYLSSMVRTMPILLNRAEANELFAHINHSNNARKNMHTRDIATLTRGKREWGYLNGMKSTRSGIKGHVHYRNGDEIEYLINKDGTYEIATTKKMSAMKAADSVKSLKNNIMVAVARGHDTTPRRATTPNQYYLVRQDWGLTKTARAAIKSGDLSKEFLEKMAKWQLCLIKGRPKK